jgi:hypothetical protein
MFLFHRKEIPKVSLYKKKQINDYTQARVNQNKINPIINHIGVHIG